MREKAAVDWWIRSAVWLVVVVVAITPMMAQPDERLVGYVVGAPIIGFLLWLYFGTYYELRQEHLYVRSGPFYRHIPYDTIKSVQLCQSIMSSMALSINRIKLMQHDKGWVLGTTYISPTNREDFFEKLVAKCTRLEDTK